MDEAKRKPIIKWAIVLFVVVLAGVSLFLILYFPRPEPGHFTPSEDSPLRLEFSYPPEWGLLEEKDANIITPTGEITLQGGLIGISDPNAEYSCPYEYTEGILLWKKTKCGIATHNFSGPPSILTRVLNIGGKANWGVDFVAIMYSPQWAENKPYNVLIDKLYFIDGYPARRIAFAYDPSKDSSDPLCRGCSKGFKDEIFLDVNGKQYLIAFFSNNREDYHSEFYEQFNALVETIKVVP